LTSRKKPVLRTEELKVLIATRGQKNSKSGTKTSGDQGDTKRRARFCATTKTNSALLLCFNRLKAKKFGGKRSF